MKKEFRIILISATIYVCINMFENLIYYSIGRHSDKDIQLEMPTPSDFIKIILITLSFALLQGVLTFELN